MSGQNINFDVNGQSAAGYLATRAQTNAPGVLVLHAWWGLNPTFHIYPNRSHWFFENDRPE